MKQQRSARQRAARAESAARKRRTGVAGSVVLAALALPGVWLPAAHAEGAPENGLVAFRFLHYEDSQPGLKRITVNSPSLYLLLPVGADWSVEGSQVVDQVSGATPRWQTSVSSASVMREDRAAFDVKVTRYFNRSSYSAGLAHSQEHDYKSNTLALNGAWSSLDNNTTWNIGLASTEDAIQPTNGGVNNIGKQKKRGDEFLLGLTQAVSTTDLVQVNLTLNAGEGFYNDPYKLADQRPERRKQAALLGRWNHHLEADGSTLRGSYRYYRDSFGVKAQTAQVEWAKPLSERLMLTPLLRYYSQGAARFYVAPQFDAGGNFVVPTPAADQLNSGDQRLSAFGAFTLGLRGDFKLSDDWALDASVQAYQQRGDWRWGGNGTKGLDTFRATFVQLGARRRF
jgi:hypothetical protein